VGCSAVALVAIIFAEHSSRIWVARLRVNADGVVIDDQIEIRPESHAIAWTPGKRWLRFEPIGGNVFTHPAHRIEIEMVPQMSSVIAPILEDFERRRAVSCAFRHRS
jgi:hypothetical protein